MLRIIVAIMLSLSAMCVAAQSSGIDRNFHYRIGYLYSFEPHTLTASQIERKSLALDKFWKEVTDSPEQYVPALRAEFRDKSNPAYFAYDGSKLLLSLSDLQAERVLALDSISRADLRDIQHTDYLRTVHWFAVNGFDTTTAALRILDFPDFKAFIVQHALTLGQNYSLIYMLFPMPEANYISRLIERLEVEEHPASQSSILLALWYTVNRDAREATTRFVYDESRPEESRLYARELVDRSAPLTGYLTFASETELREERRKVMLRLSDEALLEFDSITEKLLAKQ
jgi:hypothetical protein